MRLTEKALKAINTKEIRPLLALKLKKSESSIMRFIRENEENGMLTTAAALQLIKEETGLSEILLEGKELAKAV